jgi:ATP-dependent Clp protease ATP-binding subunit ClpA
MKNITLPKVDLSDFNNMAIVGKTRTGTTTLAIRLAKELLSKNQHVTVLDSSMFANEDWCKIQTPETSNSLMVIHAPNKGRGFEENFDDCEICKTLSQRIESSPKSYLIVDQIHPFVGAIGKYLKDLIETEEKIRLPGYRLSIA